MKRIVANVEVAKLLQLPKFLRDLTSEFIVAKMKAGEEGEVGQGRRDWAGEVEGVEV